MTTKGTSRVSQCRWAALISIEPSWPGMAALSVRHEPQSISAPFAIGVMTMSCPAATNEVEKAILAFPRNTTGHKGSLRQLPTMVAVPPSLLPTNWSTSSIGFATANELLPA